MLLWTCKYSATSTTLWPEFNIVSILILSFWLKCLNNFPMKLPRFLIKRARKSPCRCFIASRQVIPMVIIIHIVPGALYFFLFTMMWTLWGPGSRLLFWLGRLPTVQACRLFACPATRRPVHIKSWQKLVNQHHNAHHCNPSTVCRGVGLFAH